MFWNHSFLIYFFQYFINPDIGPMEISSAWKLANDYSCTVVWRGFFPVFQLANAKENVKTYSNRKCNVWLNWDAFEIGSSFWATATTIRRVFLTGFAAGERGLLWPSCGHPGLFCNSLINEILLFDSFKSTSFLLSYLIIQLWCFCILSKCLPE